jgi:Domain of unknown function (DUF4852)
MRQRFLLLTFVFLLVGQSPSFAEEGDYADATWPNLVRTLVRFNAIDMQDSAIVDEYSIITECDLYKSFYQNDFKWNQVREAVRKSISMNIATFPVKYHYDVKMQLDRYDFPTKVFRFTNKSIIENVNTFTLYSVEGTGCGIADVKNMPRSFRAVIATPIYIDGLPFTEQDANVVLKLMDADENISRIIYASFNMHMTYIEPLQKTTSRGSGNMITTWTQGGLAAHTVRLDAQLDSIDFYEDAAKKRRIYTYQP